MTLNAITENFSMLDLYYLYLCLNQRTGCTGMNTPQDIHLNEKSPLHWVLCSENWEDLVIIDVLELNTNLINSNYSDVSTQDLKRSYFDGPHSQCRKSRKKPKREKLTLSIFTFLILMQWSCRNLEYSLTIELESED